MHTTKRVILAILAFAGVGAITLMTAELVPKWVGWGIWFALGVWATYDSEEDT